MASGEQLIEDLFGFEELTGENVSPSSTAGAARKVIGTKIEVSPKYLLEKEKIKRDTDELIIPIISEKSGVKKYKVLARHQVEDDEDIRRPGSSERASPNSEEQRKENINIKQKCDHPQKQKLDDKKNVKRHKIKCIEKTGEHSLKRLKQSLNVRRPTSKLDKVKNRKHDQQKVKGDKTREKRLSTCIGKDPREVNYEFNVDFDTNNELLNQKHKTGEEPGSEKREECDTSIKSIRTQESFEGKNLEKEQVKQSQFKVKCHVKLKRDPSIESLYKALSDSDSKDSTSVLSLSESVSTSHSDKSSARCSSELSSYSDSDQINMLSRQSSYEEKAKLVDMVYNADIQVRKSGRLQSAKCASRYRGDYGIRVDTYKQLVGKTLNTDGANGSTGSENRKFDEQFYCEDIEAALIGKPKTVIGVDNITSPQVMSRLSENEDETVASKSNISAEVCKSDIYSGEFTVLKVPAIDCSAAVTDISLKESCPGTEYLVEQEIFEKGTIDKEIDSSDGVSDVKKYTDGMNKGDSHPYEKIENSLTESYANVNSIVGNKKDQLAESHMLVTESAKNDQQGCSEFNDQYRCEHKMETENSHEKSDSCRSATETACHNISDEVPCVNRTVEREPCVSECCTNKTIVGNTRTDFSVSKEKWDSGTSNQVSTEVQTDRKCLKSFESKIAKEKINKRLEALQNKVTDTSTERGGYVHSVGKSVNKIQKRMEIKRPVSGIRQEKINNEIPSVTSPVKDAAKVLENLRQKLFESAGADAVEADKVPKQFESKLISSKQRKNTDNKVPFIEDICEQDSQIKECDSASNKSGKSTPKCSTPRSEAGREILEEVAKSLDLLQKAKRKSKSKERPLKRRRFEEKKFLLRSMIKDNEQGADSEVQKPEIEVDSHSCESNSSNACSVSTTDSVERSCVKKSLEETCTAEKQVSKQKPVKCSACSHIFKTKELLRKHFPCRIRQTRTWSQNKLRPNRAVKRVENSSKKFVCKLPKSCKSETNISRPQLLTYRKTKFRRVKGKRRRRLYQLIQDLRQKRMPVKWPHLSIMYEDLSFKEQCLYKLGLICIGSAAEGLEKYTAEEITVFEQHRAKERWITEDARLFEHSIPEFLKPFSDLNLSTATELSTDNQESDFNSPKSVINLPQENTTDTSCDIQTSVEEKTEGSNTEMSEVEVCEKSNLELTGASAVPNVSSSKDKEVPWCLSYIQNLGQFQMNNNDEEALALDEIPEKVKAIVSIQQPLECFRNLRKDDQCSVEVVSGVEICKRFQTVHQLQTLTSTSESSVNVEEAEELPNIMENTTSVKTDLVVNLFEKADVKEIEVCATDASSPESSSQVVEEYNQQELIKLNDEEMMSSSSLGNNSLTSNEDVNDASKLLKDDSYQGLQTVPDVNEIKSPSVLVTEHLSQDVFEKSSTSLEECVAKKELNEIDSEVSDQNTLIADNPVRTDCDVTGQEPMKNYYLKQKVNVGPDIERFHQTAIIDDKILESGPYAQLERASGKDTVSSVLKSEINNDLITQAGRVLEGILEDVNATVNGGKNGHVQIGQKSPSSTSVTANRMTSSTNETTDISPVKGILKKACQVKESLASSPLKTASTIDQVNENSLKSPGKKKIDFKTYAKRKGMIKEKDDKEKEYMRSESNHEIEEGLLGRLLDAVNVIDSIIEEHKEKTEPDDECFNAITPEMAFEAALLSCKRESCMEEENKPYDIESVFPQSEVDDIVDVEQMPITTSIDFSRNVNFTDKVMQSEGISCYVEDDRNMTIDSEHKSDLLSKEDDSITESNHSNNYHVTESYSGKNIDNIKENIYVANEENLAVSTASLSLVNGDGQQLQESTEPDTSEMDSENDSDVSGIKGNSLDFDSGADLEYEGKVEKDTGEPNVIKCSEVNVSGSTSDSLEVLVTSPSLLLNEDKHYVEEKVQVSEKVTNGAKHIFIVKENDSAEIMTEDISEKMKNTESKMPSSVDTEIGLLDVQPNTIENNREEFCEILKVVDAETKSKSFEEGALVESPTSTDTDIIKSPGHIPKRCKKTTQATNIKESKKDFTIKYEINGIVVKENLLTGDKNVVENSSPFRSSAESDSNFDQSSQSELDVSFAIENDSSFDRNAVVNDKGSFQNTTVAPSTVYNPVAVVNDAVADEEQHTDNEDFHKLSDEVTVEVGENDTTNEKKCLEDEAENKMSKGIELTVRSSSNMENETFETGVNAEMTSDIIPSIETEKLPCENVHVVKVFDDHSVGSPPVLEKVADSSIEEFDEESCSQVTDISLESGPPILEPQGEEENEKKCGDESQVKTSQKTKSERHFLDVLGVVGSEIEGETAFPSFEKKFHLGHVDNDGSSGKSILEKLYTEESAVNDSIGRHFSDVVSETVEVPKTPKSKLLFLFDKSETKEVTLSQIKDILTPFSKTGKETSIPEESLLKIKSGIANLLAKVKKPVKKDPSWLKRNPLSGYSREKKQQEKCNSEREINRKNESSDEEILSEQEDIDYTSSESIQSSDRNADTENIETGAKTSSEVSVADTILQMLTTLEDKGSIAENMSNLLDILAENLGFLGRRKSNDEFDSSSESDYDYSDTGEVVVASGSSSTENTQKELITGYLDEGEQPPSLDDIPTAGNCSPSVDKEEFDLLCEDNDLISEKIEKEKMCSSELSMVIPEGSNAELDSLGAWLDQLPSGFKTDSVKGKPSHTDTGDAHFVSESKLGKNVNEKAMDLEISVDETLPIAEVVENKISAIERNWSFSSFDQFEEVTQINDQGNEEKRKASTIFKSITELNSIETDEESNSGETYDAVSMSVRLSELKALPKNNQSWEFDSDFNSDQDEYDKTDSDFETEKEEPPEHSKEVHEVHELNENALYECVSETQSAVEASEEIKETLTSNMITNDKENFGNQKPGINKTSKQVNIRSESGNQPVDINRNTPVEDTELSFEDLPLCKALRKGADASDGITLKDSKNVENIEHTQICQSSAKENYFKEEQHIAEYDQPSVNRIQDNLFSRIIPTAENGEYSDHSDDKEDFDSKDGSSTRDSASLGDTGEKEQQSFKTQTDSEYLNLLKAEKEDIFLSSKTKTSESVLEYKENSASGKGTTDVDNKVEKLEKTAAPNDYNFIEDQLSKSVVNNHLNSPDLNSLDIELNSGKIAGNSESSNTDSGLNLRTENKIDSKNADSIPGDSFDSVISLDNEDSNETVAYDELEEAKTDFTDMIEEVNKESLSAANVEVGSIYKECDKNDMGAHEKCIENGTLRDNTLESDVPITVKHEKRKHNGSVSNNLKEKENVSNMTEKQERQMKESDRCTSKKVPGNKQLSTSISVDSGDVSESFCETIAEKVKRKQRDRSKSYCYSFNPWLYCSAAYVRDVTKPAKKEISVFRSSILEKRARERGISPDKEENCSPRKIRNGSVQKEDLSINGSAGTCTNDGKSSSVQKVPCEVKPCAVVLPKLTEDMIKRYTSRKRKSDEDLPSEHRPPIKVTIKLSQIVYPPNSPYGSTSVSSDTGRSGYESCSEESGSETNVLEEEEELDSVEQMKVDNDVIDMKDLNRDSINGVNAKRSDNSHRAPLKIKMRTLLTKMNSFEKCVDQQNSVQETDHMVPMPVNVNESSSETNIDVSSGELIESEVLHDIKQECEKVKTGDSDVLFYISDSENEPDVAKETSNLSENIETTDQDEVKLGSLSESHVIASCGESDVDLSDSDTESDSEIQEEIDKILNAKSSDVLCDSVQHEEADNTKMGKGKSGIMKMIVSDLRLSESESESEADESECKQNFVTEGVTKGIVDSQTNSVFLHSNGKDEIACLTNVESWPHDTETGFQIEDEIEDVKGENIQNTCSELLKENSSEEPSSENSYSNISLVETSRKNEEPCYSSVERNSLEKKDSETENIFELLDLSKNSQVPASCESNTEPITVSEKEMTGITQKPLTNDLTCSEHSQLLSSVDKEDIGSILKNQLPPENCDLSFDKESGNMSLDNFTSIEDSVSFSSRDDYQIEKVIEKYPDELGKQISSQIPGQLLSVNVADSESKADVSSLELCIHEANEEQITVEDSSCTINVSSIGNEIRHSNITKECEILEDSLTLDERKELENANAVKNLVGDTFENLHQVQESTKEDMFYYAVELSDDLETSEAVVNLESVIIKSPVIAEDTEICEENIVNSSFIQSHVNSQFDLQTEPLNEQIVEIGNDNKLVSELKEKDSQERMTHMENPFYYPVVSDVNSKYLYGINEDSQSSDDVVEELVTDIIVNDNADLKQMEQPINIEDKEVFQQGSIVESSNIKFPRDLTVRDVPSHSQGSVNNMKTTDLCAELSEGPMDVETSCVECNVNSESEHSNEEIEKETVLNISENLNTLMCSGSVPVDKVDICTGVSDTETSRLSINKDGNSFLQENEQCEIVVECNDENDYIITQNEFFDDDNIMDIT